MREIIGQLETIRRRAWLALVAQRAARLLAIAGAVLLLLIALDWMLRLPGAVRGAALAAGLAALLVASWSWVGRAISFHPTLVQIALRVERVLPRVSGRLASSVEFAAAGVDRANPLAARAVAETESRLSGESFRGAMRLGRTWRDCALLLGVLAIGASWSFTHPAAARTGFARALAPWSDARWPARTGVRSLMDEVLPETGVHPRGQALALRAEVTRGPIDQRLRARVRFGRADGTGAWEDLLLTHQGDGVHERLVDTDAAWIEVAFLSDDDRTDVRRIDLVPPPAVERAHLVVSPPPYASERLAALEQEMGPGTDHRSVTESPSLVGSPVRLELELNKPLPVPAAGPRRDTWLAETLGWPDAPRPRFDVDDDDPRRWTLKWTLTDTRELRLALEDEYGLTGEETMRYRIEAVADRDPAVTIVEPESDEVVLAAALVPLRSEASDDVAVRRLVMEAGVRRADTGTADAAPAWRRAADGDGPQAELDAEIDLAPLELREGDVVEVTAIAEDLYELDGARHEPARSAVRRLRVISPLDFSSQLRRALGAVRQNAIRIEALQSELQDDVTEAGPEIGAEHAQAQLAERIAAQRESIAAIERQRRTNRLDDAGLEDLVRQSNELLEFAGRAATRAVAEIERRQAEGGAADEPPPTAGVPREADRPIVEAQQEVREELADLIELLDRDEDTWVVTRQLEGLLEQQRELRERTGEAGRRTMGRERDELTESERADLDRIADAQRDLQEQAQQLVEELRERAEAMEEVDPDSAAGMRSAANTGDQRELQRDMERAAGEIQENRLERAGGDQEDAAQTLERMLEDIEESKRATTEQLLRRLASLVESITRLVTVQENELIALAAARAEDVFTGRDRSMIRLHQNTESVAGEARAAGPPARRIARTLDRAGDAQGSAVLALRAAPIDAEGAQEAEDRSLEMLREALALAEALQAETEQEQVEEQRDALIESYRALAEREMALRGEVIEIAGRGDIGRRELMDLRRGALEQDAIGDAVGDLRRSSQELMEAAVFTFVHEQIAAWAETTSDAMRDGDASVDVTDRQRMIAGAIGGIIDALEEAQQPPDEFAQDDAGEAAGGGGGGQPPELVPPVAELRLLQSSQREIYDQTRDLDGRDDLDPARRRQRLRELGDRQRRLQELGEALIEELGQ